MKYIEGADRHQMILFPEKLDDLVTDDNPVRVIDAFVDNLDLQTLGFKYSSLDTAEAGHPCYPPWVMLKLYMYGYFNKVRSSRRLQWLCETNTDVMWLTGQMTPDFRTVSDFRKDHIKQIKQVFKLFTQMCVELGLYSKEIGVQDGSKFRAVNSKDNNLTESKLNKKLELIEEKIAKYLGELDKNDAEEGDSQKYTREEIEEMLKKVRERKDFYEALQKMMKEEEISQVSFTDPDSRLMRSANGGFDVSYNVQIVVDPVSHMIGAFDATNQGNDMGQLSPVAEQLKEDLGIDVLEVVADKGYEDRADMLNCLMNGAIPHIPSKSGEDSYEFELDYKEAEITEEMLNSTASDDIKACLEAGVLPNAYKDRGIEVSVFETEQYGTDETDSEACFTLNEEGTAVICPNGLELSKVATLHGKGKTRFASRSACKKCDEKCTASSHKQVDLKDGQTVLSARKYRQAKKVKITLTPDKAKIWNRKCVVEHPFGTIKRWLDGSYTLLIGEEKVGADLALMFLSYNIKRAISMIGIQALIEGIGEKMKEIMEGYSCFICSVFNIPGKLAK
jgi:transposase